MRKATPTSNTKGSITLAIESTEELKKLLAYKKTPSNIQFEGSAKHGNKKSDMRAFLPIRKANILTKPSVIPNPTL